MPLGTTSGHNDGPSYNEVSAFIASNGRIVFKLHYTDPETHQVRFVGRGAAKRVDEVQFIVEPASDLSFLARLAEISADAILTLVERQRIRATTEAKS